MSVPCCCLYVGLRSQSISASPQKSEPGHQARSSAVIPQLKLQEVLNTPAFLGDFRSFLDDIYCGQFINFLEAADDDTSVRADIPAFVAEIKTIFERWQLAAYLEVARETEQFDPSLFEGDDEFSAEDVEDMRKDDIRHCTRDLLLVERAREWLSEELRGSVSRTVRLH